MKRTSKSALLSEQGGISMKAKQCQLKERIGKVIFCFIFVFNFSKHPVFAEEDTQENAFANLIYFQPRIHIAEKAEPCLGVRVSKKQIFTSPSCARQIFALFKQGVEVNVLNPGGVILGQIQTSHDRADAAGFLSIELYADNLPYQPPVMSTTNATNGIELSAYYMLESNEEVNVTKHYFTFDSQQNAGVQTLIKLPSDISLPDGAPVKLRNKLFCVVVGDTCIRSSYLLSAFKNDNDPRCPGANGTYHFHCGERAIDDCSEDVTPGVGVDTTVSGTCVNPESKEQCTFDSLYTQNFDPDGGGYAGRHDYITCKSCSAKYSWSSSPDLPGKLVLCKPKGCMPGCKGKPDPKPDPKHSGKNSVDAIVGGTIGGVAALAVIGAIVSVAGCLIYKRHHRATYQNL